jgi:hypothetical protein
MIRSLAIAIAFIFLLRTAAGCRAQSNRPPEGPQIGIDDPPPIPQDLLVTGLPILRVHATGVQIYVWATRPEGSGAWTLRAPDATFSGGGMEGRHFAGPTWECTADGSKIVGRKIAEHAAPYPNAVAWLLLEAKSHEGEGILSKVTFVQRIQTVGGKPPLTTDPKVGDEIRVPYSADYVFYGPGATTRP